MQAKDISDDQFRAAVIATLRPGYDFSTLYAVAEQFPHAPHKVVQAKLAKLIRRGLIDGCACGCSSPMWLTDNWPE